MESAPVVQPTTTQPAHCWADADIRQALASLGEHVRGQILEHSSLPPSDALPVPLPDSLQTLAPALRVLERRLLALHAKRATLMAELELVVLLDVTIDHTDTTEPDEIGTAVPLSDIAAARIKTRAESWPLLWETPELRSELIFKAIYGMLRDIPTLMESSDAVALTLGISKAWEFVGRSRAALFEARRAWTLVDAIATGAVIDGRRVPVEGEQVSANATGAFELLRDIALQRIGSEATDDQRDELAKAVMQNMREMRDRLGMTEPPPATNDEATRLGIRFNSAFLRTLERIGNTGAAAASEVRSKDDRLAAEGAADTWRLWRYSERGAPFLTQLAHALWIDIVEPDLKRRERNHEALALPVHAEVVKVFSRAGALSKDTRQLRFEDGTAISFDSPLLDAAGIELVYRGIGLLGSVDAHRLLQWQVRSGYQQWINGSPSPHVLDVERGYGELAERLHIRDKGATQRLRAILNAQKTCNFPIPGTTRAWANLIILWEWEGSGRRPGRLRIELGSMLMPTFIHELQGEFKGRNLATVQRLVPLVGLPPFVGNERSHGAQATLAMLITREMRLRAPELYQRGGIQMDLPRWAQLAEEARVPRSEVSQRLGAILNRWTRDGDKKRDGDDAPAFLKKEGKHSFTLADSHEPARRFLMEAGKREAERSKAGQRSVEKRQAKLNRLTRKAAPDR